MMERGSSGASGGVMPSGDFQASGRQVSAQRVDEQTALRHKNPGSAEVDGIDVVCDSEVTAVDSGQ